MTTVLEDALGILHPIDQPPSRVISLVPSLTETLFELGAGDAVVGVTDFCIYPPEPTSALPRLGGTKNPKISRIRQLHPDLVYVNIEENLERHASAIGEFTRVFATEPKTVEDVSSLMLTLGRIHAKESVAHRWIEELRSELERVEVTRFTFICPIWKDPWMWCGGDTYVSALIEAAGGTNLFGDSVRYPAIDLVDALSRKPDIIFLPDEPYAFDQEEAEALQSRTKGRVVGPFPGHLVTWHGTRTLKGLRFVREAVG